MYRTPALRTPKTRLLLSFIETTRCKKENMDCEIVFRSTRRQNLCTRTPEQPKHCPAPQIKEFVMDNTLSRSALLSEQKNGECIFLIIPKIHYIPIISVGRMEKEDWKVTDKIFHIARRSCVLSTENSEKSVLPILCTAQGNFQSSRVFIRAFKFPGIRHSLRTWISFSKI